MLVVRALGINVRDPLSTTPGKELKFKCNCTSALSCVSAPALHPCVAGQRACVLFWPLDWRCRFLFRCWLPLPKSHAPHRFVHSCCCPVACHSFCSLPHFSDFFPLKGYPPSFQTAATAPLTANRPLY